MARCPGVCPAQGDTAPALVAERLQRAKGAGPPSLRGRGDATFRDGPSLIAELESRKASSGMRLLRGDASAVKAAENVAAP